MRGGAELAEALKYMEMAVNRSDRAVLISDAQRAVCYVNPAFTHLFGYTIEDVNGAHPWELLAGPLTDERLHTRAKSSIEGQVGFYDDLLLRTKSGEAIWVSAKIDPVFDAEGNLVNVVALFADITRTKRLQVLQREVLDALSEDMPIEQLMSHVCSQVEMLAPDVTCSVLRVDSENRLRPLAAPSMPAFFSKAVDGALIGPEAGSCGAAAWRKEPVISQDIETDPLWLEYRELVLPLGYKACWSVPMVLRDGRVAGTFAFYFKEKRGPSPWHQQLVDACTHFSVMAIERHDAKTSINRLVYYDALTGLPNRALMRQQLGKTFAADPERQQRFAFLFLDMDRFKDVNDTFGQPVGDDMLAAIGQRLVQQVCSADMVARMGGDGFVIILNDCDAEQAAKVSQKLIASLLEPVEAAGNAIPLSSSVGIALYPDDATDIDTLLKYCDTAMYEAKAAGRGGYSFYSPAMNALNQDRLLLGTALREALAQGRLEMHYQPQVNAMTGQLYGMEALARWTHDEFGPVGPARFVRIAEQIGISDALGVWALHTACSQLAAWRARGFAVPSVSVNISPTQFRNPEFCELVRQCLEQNRLVPSDLSIEITEGLMLDETAAVTANTRALAQMGVKLSMDDFGTGYSSLSLVARLPVSELKVDRSFMNQLEEDTNAQAVVTAVICIGQSLSMTVVAEGVETDAQRRFLTALGCAVQQGYLYAKPMPVAALEDWMGTYCSPSAVPQTA